jgi:hypothetical protein
MADPRSKQPSNVAHANGMTEFWRLLKDIQHLFAWRHRSRLAFLSLAPPWPPAVSQITTLLELVVLVLIYQYLKGAPRDQCCHCSVRDFTPHHGADRWRFVMGVRDACVLIWLVAYPRKGVLEVLLAGRAFVFVPTPRRSSGDRGKASWSGSAIRQLRLTR